MILHARKGFRGRLVLQVFAAGKYRDARPDDKLPHEFEAIGYVELHDLRARVAQAERRAEAQRRSRARKETQPAGEPASTEQQ